MGFSHLLSTEVSLANFREVFNISGDVDVTYYHEGDIALHQRSGFNIVFFPLMAILEGGVRFPVNPLLLSTLRFYGLCHDQLPLNFYRVVSCINRLNQIYRLKLNHRDINFMYNLCGNLKSNYYLKARDVRVWLISCLPNSNRNSAGEYVQVSSNWLANELPSPLSSCEVGQYREPLFFFSCFTCDCFA